MQEAEFRSSHLGLAVRAENDSWLVDDGTG